MSPEIQACLQGKIPATNVKESRLDGYWKNVLLTALTNEKIYLPCDNDHKYNSLYYVLLVGNRQQ
jgi:hypothetical protein